MTLKLIVHFLFDQRMEVYKKLQQAGRESGRVILESLGAPPKPPPFIRVAVSEGRVEFRVPLYTDIDDEAFLSKIRTVIENFWQAGDGDMQYRVALEWRRKSFAPGPSTGEHINLNEHVARFPSDGGVLTTGAESTHAFVGRYIALAAADTAYRTVAHEFGHILGFSDGYFRGYTDLGASGFEILEVIPSFDDLMSAPGSGSVQAAHFKLLLAALNRQ